jgi:hypothetical protein
MKKNIWHREEKQQHCILTVSVITFTVGILINIVMGEIGDKIDTCLFFVVASLPITAYKNRYIMSKTCYS